MKRILRSFVMLIFFLCFSNTPSLAATIDVAARNNFFDPANITIDVGDTVRWTNLGTVIHTTTSGTNCAPDGTWNSGSLLPGQSFSVIFNEPGTLPYYCIPHCFDGMRGSVTVRSSSTPVPTGQQIFTYPATGLPARNLEPSQAKPIGVGSVADNGNILSVRVDTGSFAGSVDVYFAIFAPAVARDDFFLLQPDSMTFFLLSVDGLGQPWMANTSGDINVALFGDVSLSLIPPGTYELYLVVTPAGSLGSFYAWKTSFTVF